MSKKCEKLTSIISIKFKNELIILTNDDDDKSLFFTESKQFNQMRLVNIFAFIDLTSS